DLAILTITDRDGLVLADADPARNGRPLAEERLRPLLARPEPTTTELAIDGRPLLVAASRVSSTEGAPRIAWVGASLRHVADAQTSVRKAGRDAVRFGWVLVALGGFIIAVVAAGAVMLIGGSVTRRLQVLSWRIGQLGRGDRTTHLHLDGPDELQQVG